MEDIRYIGMNAPPFSLIQRGRFGKSATLYNGNCSRPFGRKFCSSTLLGGTRTVLLNEIRRSPSPMCNSLDSILAGNKDGLNLAKYLTNGVSIFISVSVEGPDVTLRLFRVPEVVVVDIMAV